MMSPQETLEFVTAGSRRHARTSRRRARTVRSARAEGVVVELRGYFRSASQLASALGTSRDTLRAWSTPDAPARPRVELLDATELLLALCQATRRYVAADLKVGEWVNAPDPRLGGCSPAQALRRYGRDGLGVLLAGLAVVAPPRPAGPVELPSLEDLRTALARGMSAEDVQRIERIAAAEPIVLSDAELDAELASVDAEQEPDERNHRD
jgi:hypothetical protein